MSADSTEQDPAGGDELRARYLPVSRKELRRRREAELAAQRAAHEEAEAASDQLAEDSETGPEAGVEAAADPEGELARAVEDTEAVEALELPAPPAREDQQPQEADTEDPAAEIADADTAEEAAAEEAAAEEAELLAGEEDDAVDEALEDIEAAEAEETTEVEEASDADQEAAEPAGEIPADAPEAELPQPLETDEPARPEEDLADAAEAAEPDVELSADEVAALTAEQDEEPLDEGEGTDGAAERDSEGDEDSDDETVSADPPQEFFDDQEAPIPASRRGRRLLRETESLPKLDPELLAELNETTGEIAKNDDPNRVDPELLKKQQALAAKAMQANQERMRQQQAESQQAEQRRGHQRPESQVITGKTLRDSSGEDIEQTEFLTGQIAPIQAQGAHGLELNEMMDETSRLAGRQSVLLWLVVVLAVLLLIAVVAILFWP